MAIQMIGTKLKIKQLPGTQARSEHDPENCQDRSHLGDRFRDEAQDRNGLSSSAEGSFSWMARSGFGWDSCFRTHGNT